MNNSRVLKIHLYVLGLIVFVACADQKTNSISKGKEVYIAHCVSCHQESGKGLQGYYPSLVRDGIITSDQTIRAITLIKQGSGFRGGMKPINLTDEETVDVLNYIQNSWGNQAELLDSLPKIK